MQQPVKPSDKRPRPKKDGESKEAARPDKGGYAAEGARAPYEPKLPGKRIAQVSVPGKYVALTFDDGPHPVHTPRILDILNRYGAKATFFVLGENATRNRSVMARAVREGHEIGSHTWNHMKLTGHTLQEARSQMDRTNAVIYEATGRRPRLMRPPYGATNESVINFMASRYGMPSIMWNVDTFDWKHPGVSVVVDRAVNNAKSGSIILMHDIHGSTADAVEGVVAGLKARGFQLVTVSRLVEMARRAARAPQILNPEPQQKKVEELAPAPQLAPATAPQNSLPPAPEEPGNSLPPAQEAMSAALPLATEAASESQPETPEVQPVVTADGEATGAVSEAPAEEAEASRPETAAAVQIEPTPAVEES